jgi:hypothetical protein
MADTKITGLTALTAVDASDVLAIVDDPGGTPATKKVTVTDLASLLAPQIAQGRLTLTTATPVTTADVSGATTLYFTPYKGNKIAVYDGSKWDVFSFTELSLSLSGYTASKPYDIWVYDNSGTLTLDSTIWTDGTNRATALAYQDGVYVKSGDATRRYLGTIYINSTGGQTEDTDIARFVWNYYNRIPRRFYKLDNTDHGYTTGSWRAWNNDATNKVEWIVGVLESPNLITINGGLNSDGSTLVYSGIGYDVVSGALDTGVVLIAQNAKLARSGSGLQHYGTIGYHYYAGVQLGATGGNYDNILIGGNILG